MYILILVFIHGYGSRPMTVMQEFSTEQTCVVASQQIKGAYQRDGTERLLLQNVCVRK